MTKQQIHRKALAQVKWAEAHLAKVIELECSATVVEGARRILARTQAHAAQT